MQAISFIVAIGIALVIFYLFLRKIFNDGRLKFPDEKPQPEEKCQKPQVKQPPDENLPAPDAERPEPAEESGEPYDVPPEAKECPGPSPAGEIKAPVSDAPDAQLPADEGQDEKIGEDYFD